MLATSQYEYVYKYTRKDQQSLDWTKEDGELKIDTLEEIRCIDNNVYIVSEYKRIYRFSNDLSE